MDYSTDRVFTGKNILIFLVLILMIVAIPIAVYLAKQQTQLKSKAAGDASMSFTGDGVKQESNGQFTTTSKDIQVQVTSPFGAAQSN